MDNFIPDEVKIRLLGLRKKYFLPHEGTLESFSVVFQKYLKKRKMAIIDSLVASANLSLHIFDGEPDPLALQAIKMTNPNFDPSMLSSYTDDQLTGIINSAKGKYFELLVTDKLNNGERVGDLVLPDGYHAELAESLTQPGWDIAIKDASGDVADHLQLKATENLSYISEALHKYPDIKILATEEAANHLPDGYTMVSGSGIEDDHLTSTIESTIHHGNEGLFDKFGDSFHPLAPLSIILAIEGYKLFAKKQSVEAAIKNGSERFGRSLFSTATGAFVYALGGGFLALPAAFGAGLYYRRVNNLRKISEMMRENINKLKEILQFHRQKRSSVNGNF
ncbi:MAG: hypothetical protein LCH52_01005 [Bacteroidetes bacterium]|nr:hypothetical protein [Bacteroidota bacterium]